MKNLKILGKVLIGIGLFFAIGRNVILPIFNMLFGRLERVISWVNIIRIYNVVNNIFGGFLPYWVLSYGTIVLIIGGFILLIKSNEKITNKKYISPLVITGFVLYIIIQLIIPPLFKYLIENASYNMLGIMNIAFLLLEIASFALIIIGYIKLLGIGFGNKENSESLSNTQSLAERKADADQEKSYFDGGFWQLVGWSLLGGLVLVITLGIALPWVYCWITRWRLNHTVIGGKRLQFNGTGLSLFGHYILRGWLLGLILTPLTLGLYPFYYYSISLKKWETKNTSFSV